MPDRKDNILDILIAAIQREVSAYDFYYKSSESSPFPETKSLLLQLAREEKKHRDILTQEYRTVKRMLQKGESRKVYFKKEEVSYFVPDEIPFRKVRSIPEVELACVSLPSEFLGGDYFETLIIPHPEKDVNHLSFLLYDIMGHGLNQTSLKAKIRDKFEILKDVWSRDKSILSPAAMLSRLGIEIWKDCQESESFVELFYAIYDPEQRKITYSSAGHPPPFLVTSQGQGIKVLTDTDLVMGLVQSKEYRDSYMPVEPGDVLALYTDGAVEALDPDGEFYDEKRLIKTVQENSHLNSEQIVQNVLKSIKEFTRNKPLEDELNLVIARIK